MRHCPDCGVALSEKLFDGAVRPYCESCERVHFIDPKVAAVVVTSDSDMVLMVRRGVEPAYGEWSFPSGYVDRGEAVEDAAAREVEEETGLTVRLTRLVGVYSQTDSPIILIVFDGVITGGEERPGHDVLEVGRFHKDALPPLPFPHDQSILKDWLAARPHGT